MLAHHSQQIIDVCACLDEKRRDEQGAQLQIGIFQIFLQECTDRKRADDVIRIPVTNGNTRVRGSHDQLLDLLVGHGDINADNVLTHSHHVCRSRAGKFKRRLEHIALLLVNHTLFLDRIDDVKKLILGDGGLFLSLEEFGNEFVQKRKNSHNRCK